MAKEHAFLPASSLRSSDAAGRCVSAVRARAAEIKVLFPFYGLSSGYPSEKLAMSICRVYDMIIYQFKGSFDWGG